MVFMLCVAAGNGHGVIRRVKSGHILGRRRLFSLLTPTLIGGVQVNALGRAPGGRLPGAHCRRLPVRTSHAP